MLKWAFHIDVPVLPAVADVDMVEVELGAMETLNQGRRAQSSAGGTRTACYWAKCRARDSIRGGHGERVMRSAAIISARYGGRWGELASSEQLRAATVSCK